MKTLHLNVKKKWFDLIAAGEKKIEYRKYKPYWQRRLIKSVGIVIIMHVFDEIHFKNGFKRKNGSEAPFMRVKHIGTSVDEVIFPGKKEPEEYFSICLGKILEIRNWNK